MGGSGRVLDRTIMFDIKDPIQTEVSNAHLLIAQVINEMQSVYDQYSYTKNHAAWLRRKEKQYLSSNS